MEIQRLREGIARLDEVSSVGPALERLAHTIQNQAEFIEFVQFVADFQLSPGDLEYGEPFGYLDSVAAIMESNKSFSETLLSSGVSPWAVVALNLYWALSYE